MAFLPPRWIAKSQGITRTPFNGPHPEAARLPLNGKGAETATPISKRYAR
jgi:hypothetical protein